MRERDPRGECQSSQGSLLARPLKSTTAAMRARQAPLVATGVRAWKRPSWPGALGQSDRQRQLGFKRAVRRLRQRQGGHVAVPIRAESTVQRGKDFLDKG